MTDQPAHRADLCADPALLAEAVKVLAELQKPDCIRVCTTTGGPNHEGQQWVHKLDHEALRAKSKLATDTIAALLTRISAQEKEIKELDSKKDDYALKWHLACEEAAKQEDRVAKLVEAAKDAADDWAECLGHVVTALGEKPDWYGHETQAIREFRAIIAETGQ